MTLSEMIQKLQDLQKEHGDLKVLTESDEGECFCVQDVYSSLEEKDAIRVLLYL